MAVNDRARVRGELTWLESLEAPSREELHGRRVATRAWTGTLAGSARLGSSCSRCGS